MDLLRNRLRLARLARAGGVFTHLRDCGPSCDVVLGYARLSLARRPAAGYSLLVLDAFSSDGIPVHLLTSEALELYLARLAPDGILAFHISISPPAPAAGARGDGGRMGPVGARPA